MLKIALVAAIVIIFAPMAAMSYAQEYKTFIGAGKNAGDGLTTFDVQYSSVKNIISSSVDIKQKSIDFVLVGKADSNSTLLLKLPTGLIKGPFVGVWVDNQAISNYKITSEAVNETDVSVPITPMTEKVSIVGASIVPEFGAISAVVLAVSIFAVVAVIRFRTIRL